MPSENDGVMIVLSSPSGAGKTTLVKMLSKIDNYEISISHTTRQPRPNEINNQDTLLNSEVSSDSNDDEDDLEIPAFLRRQKN